MCIVAIKCYVSKILCILTTKYQNSIIYCLTIWKHTDLMSCVGHSKLLTEADLCDSHKFTLWFHGYSSNLNQLATTPCPAIAKTTVSFHTHRSDSLNRKDNAEWYMVNFFFANMYVKKYNRTPPTTLNCNYKLLQRSQPRRSLRIKASLRVLRLILRICQRATECYDS